MKRFPFHPAWNATTVLHYVALMLGVLGILACVILFLRGKPVPFPWYTAGGSGTDSDPYLIATCGQLQRVGTVPAASYALVQDIDCSATSGWRNGLGFLPLGNVDGFSGRLDGRGFVVRGIVINQPTIDLVGLFRVLAAGAHVEHVVLEIDVLGRDNIGALSGWSLSGSTVEDVTVRGRVRGRHTVGGLVGINEGILRTVSGEASASGTDVVGGIAGYNAENGLIESATQVGTVDGGGNVGGIAGVNRGATINGCSVKGIVQGRENVGAIVGWMLGGQHRASTMTRCDMHGAANTAVPASIGKQGTGLPASRP